MFSFLKRVAEFDGPRRGPHRSADGGENDDPVTADDLEAIFGRDGQLIEIVR